jgi:hypothetical protein
MAFRISITTDADRQFRALPARDRRILSTAIASRLRYAPTKIELLPNLVDGRRKKGGVP